MKVFKSLDSYHNTVKTAVTTGTFDGVHVGHQKIIDKLIQSAKQINGESVIVTFNPHPRIVLFPDDEQIKLLTSLEEKTELIASCGVDNLVIIPFTKEFSRISSIEFVRNIISNKLHAQKLVIGYNHHFGRNREGTFKHLQEFGPIYGFDVEEIAARDVDQIAVSSSKIRIAVSEGDPETASLFLGRPYFFNALVKSGRGLGKTIGFPTANLYIQEENKLIPGKGVYAVSVIIGNQRYKGMMNIGNNPTVSSDSQLHLEVHIHNFDQNITGQTIKVELLRRIRNEVKFNSIDELKIQLQSDRENSLI